MKNAIYLYLILFICSIYSQNNKYRLKNISTIDGLSQNSVIAIHQDKFGQMWFGTRDGLNKYDGSKFTIFRNDVDNKTSISNDILCIEEDETGKLWIGTYNGLNYYDPVSNTFDRYLQDKTNLPINSNVIWCIKKIGDEMWFGTSKGLFVYNKKTKQFASAIHSDRDNTTIPSNNITSILKSKKGQIWIGTTQGLCLLTSRKNGKFTFKNYPLNNINLLNVSAVVEDRFNNIWVGTKNKGLLKFDSSTKSFIPFLSNEKYSEINSEIRALAIDSKGSIWIGAYDGIYILGEDKSIQKINNSNTNSNHSSGIEKVKSIFIDKKGSVWIGCYFKGVNMWDISNVNFFNYDQNSKKIPMGYEVVSSIVADKNQNIYFGSEGGGITIYNKNTEATSYLNTKIGQTPINDIKSMCVAENTILWIGTFSKGISAYNTLTKKIEDYRISPQLKDSLKDAGVYSIKTEGNGILWLGTFSKGLIRYNTVSKAFQFIRNEDNKPNYLTNNYVRTVLVDKQKRLWVGTLNGLNLITLQNFQPNKYVVKHFFYDDTALFGDDISTLYQDSQNKIWVGTKAKGLHYFDGKKFNRINLKIGNTVITSIHSILEDDDKNLWISTNQGIIKYSTTRKTVANYDQKDGIANNEFNDNAALKLENKFYFGSPSGAIYFDAKNITLNQYAPQVLITNFKINNKTINANDSEGILEKSIGFTKTITLDYDKANFAINFAIPNYVRPKKNQYSYRLIGLENKWTTTNNTEANYGIQNPGTYVFEVKGANNDGVWNKVPTTLTIIVNPAPWRSIWAYLLYAMIIGLGFYGLMWIIKSKAELKQKLELECLEIKRIEENNRLKLDFFTNISHEFRTPLTLILGPLQQILSNYDGSNEMHKKLLVIEGSSNHLLNLINRLMDFRKLENHQVSLESANGNIVKFIKEIYLSFIEYAKDGGYNYTFESSEDEILVYYDRYKLERVFYNLISNAFRYTPKGGTITIKINHDNKNLFIAVEDSGVGISEEHINKIFDLFFEIPMHNNVQKNYNKGTGIGLSIVKNIVKLHKGTIDVKNKKTEGVIFKVTLPLGREHLLDNEIISDFKISDDIAQYEAQLDISEINEPEDVDYFVTNDEKKTILIVEDHKVLRSFMRNLLKGEFNIIEAENGKVAFEKAVKHVPDLIISDVIMPEMVGTELCSKIKENLRTSHIPVILLTSRSSLVYKFEGLESGADDYISKPFNLIEFKLRIKNLLDSTERLKNKFSSQDNFTPSEITVTSLDEELLKKAFKIVEDNISNEQFDIPFFCSELGVGRTVLFLKIKAWTNYTPNEFIHEIRLKRAAQLLTQNKLNVSEISYRVGFNNPKYFSKCFQKKYGKTPTQFAEKVYKESTSF